MLKTRLVETTGLSLCKTSSIQPYESILAYSYERWNDDKAKAKVRAKGTRTKNPT